MNVPREDKRIPHPEENAAGGSARAEVEDTVFAQYKEQSRKKAWQRDESQKDWWHRISLILTIVLTSVMAAVLVCGIVIWAWHVLAPMKDHWLFDDKWDRLQNIMSSVFFGIVLNEYSRKFFDKLR